MNSITRIGLLNLGKEIQSHETEYLRGAINQLLRNGDSLFHNHIDDRVEYRYPLIQYKTLNGQATLIAVNEGIEALKQKQLPSELNLRLKNKTYEFKISPLLELEFDFIVTPEDHIFQISQWLPFNQENHHRYCEAEDDIACLEILEHILIGNIISAAKGTNLFIKDQILLEILEIQKIEEVFFKGNPMLQFSLIFKSNCQIPLFIGLGKGASIGHGTITMLNDTL